MSLATNYLNLQSNNNILERLGVNVSIYSNLSSYNECFINYLSEPNKTNNYIKSGINNYIDRNYSLINVYDADINYYIERINLFVEKKFSNIIDEINLKPIISMCDYLKKNHSSNDNINHYIQWRNEYYKILWNNIICNKYNIRETKENNNIIDLLDKYWNKIKFSNIIELSNSLKKIRFLSLEEYEENINDFIKIIIEKFDENENLVKLIDYIESRFNYKNDSKNSSVKISEENLEESFIELDDYEKDVKSSNSKYNFRFIVDNLKSNGYLLFEEFNKKIKNKYKKPQEIDIIRIDKRIINYFLYLISQKDSNNTNRKVNELLISMKNYIDDIEESYYNNIAYRKITVKQESDKYKSIDLSSYNRENSTFTIFKYCNTNKNDIKEFNLSPQIEPYFDIYKSYYSSRYPDREIEFDPIKSTLIVKMVFNSKPYYIHLALIQYIIMDKLLKDINGLGINEISSQTNISIKNLQLAINSLLYIKLIKHSANTSNIIDMKFFINYNFVHSSNKISISSLVIPKEQEIEVERELMHDRNTIILSNLYDYIKKNRSFTIEQIYDELSKNKIPFKLELEQVVSAIKVMVEKEDITETNENNIKTYRYSE